MPFHKVNGKWKIVNRSIHHSLLTIYSKSKGFTLIELLVTISIIGILVGSASIFFNNARDKARDSKRKQDLVALKQALTSYYQDNDYYPQCSGSDNECDSTEGDSWIPGLIEGGYINKLPKDPKQAAVNLFFDLANFLKKPSLVNPVYASNIITISASWDGEVNGNTTCDNNDTESRIGYSSGNFYRVYFKFPLDSLPAGATINSVSLQVDTLSSIAGGGPDVDIQAYDQNGQADVQADSCTNRANRSVNDTTPYIDNDTATFSTTGQKIIALPASAYADILNAKSALNRFSLAINEDGTLNDGTARYIFIQTIERSGSGEPKLIIDYNGAAPSAPATTTVAADNTTDTGARLNGSANTNGLSGTGWFRYSTTDPVTCNDTFGTRAPASNGSTLDAGTEVRNFNRTISGLTAATTYYFCAIASSSSGTSFGSVMPFLTTGAAPAAQCSDGVDNADPEDTLIDFGTGPTNDPGCSSSSDNDETDPAPPPPPPPPPAELEGNYGYVITSFDSQSRALAYILWTDLENDKDPDRNAASCPSPPSAHPNYDYCIKSAD